MPPEVACNALTLARCAAGGVHTVRPQSADHSPEGKPACLVSTAAAPAWRSVRPQPRPSSGPLVKHTRNRGRGVRLARARHKPDLGQLIGHLAQRTLAALGRLAPE